MINWSEISLTAQDCWELAQTNLNDLINSHQDWGEQVAHADEWNRVWDSAPPWVHQLNYDWGRIAEEYNRNAGDIANHWRPDKVRELVLITDEEELARRVDILLSWLQTHLESFHENMNYWADTGGGTYAKRALLRGCYVAIESQSLICIACYYLNGYIPPYCNEYFPYEHNEPEGAETQVITTPSIQGVLGNIKNNLQGVFDTGFGTIGILLIALIAMFLLKGK